MPNLRVYRYAWVVALVLAVISLFTLGTPGTPAPSDEPVSFDGARAMLDLTTLAEQYPGRVAGSDADARAGIWLIEAFERLGLETHIDAFSASLDDRDVALQNVWAVSRGTTDGTIVVVAGRDSPPRSTQGADANASGTASLLELARVFTLTGHGHTLLFLSTDGDSFGALGARRFVETHGVKDLIAVVALRRTASREAEGLAVDGWGAAARAAPPWLWLLSERTGRSIANAETHLPGAPAQVLRLAVPTSAGSQAPFVAAGVAALSLGAAAPPVDPPDDTLNAVSSDVLVDVGRTAEGMILAIDHATDDLSGSGGTIFLRRDRTLPGGSLTLLLLSLFAPLAAVTVDLFAHCRRAHLRMLPAWIRLALHCVPWLVVIGIVYFSNLIGLLPDSPGAVISPESTVADHPRYLRVAILVVALLLAYAYATAIERRLARRVHVDQRTTVLVAHGALLLIAAAVFFVNPYSLLLVAPAAVLWPLARPGTWTRSILPVYLGLGMIAGALVFFGLRLSLGVDVWWYFFLLLENGTIPASATVLGAVFLATAGMLAHTLHGAKSLPQAVGAGAEHDEATPDDAPDLAGAASTTAAPPPSAASPPSAPSSSSTPSSPSTSSRREG